MARQRGQIVIDRYDIVGKCFGELEVVSYRGAKYDCTAGGERLRHYYNCIDGKGKNRIVQRGNILKEDK